MKHEISDETVDYVGILSKLEITGDEKEKAKADIAEMLDYIDKLGELEETLANAPEVQDQMLSVPKTF